MHHNKTDYTGAISWIVTYHSEVQGRVHELLNAVPYFGRPEIDDELHDYILHLVNWPRCNDCWNFESGRYFGKKGLEFQKTRYVPKIGKVAMDPGAKQKDVEIPLVEL